MLCWQLPKSNLCWALPVILRGMNETWRRNISIYCIVICQSSAVRLKGNKTYFFPSFRAKSLTSQVFKSFNWCGVPSNFESKFYISLFELIWASGRQWVRSCSTFFCEPSQRHASVDPSRVWRVGVFDFGTGRVGYLPKSSGIGTGRDG